MCGKSGGSPPVPNQTSTAFQSTTSPSPIVSPLYNNFLANASALAGTPFNPGMYGQVAPLNATQFQAGADIANANALFPGAVANLMSVGSNLGTFDPNQVRAIESPYIQDVVNATQNWFNNQNAIQGTNLLSQGIRSGNAFGGDRMGVAEAQLAGQQQLAQAPVIAGLYQTGYGQALDEYNRLKSLGLAGAQAALGAPMAELQGAGALMGWGGMQQQQAQRELDVAQQNAMMASAYPFQTANWYGSILGGVGPLLGTQVSGFNTPPAPSVLSGALGLGLGAAGLAAGFADRGGNVRNMRRGGLIQLPGMARGGLVGEPIILRRQEGGGTSVGDISRGDTSSSNITLVPDDEREDRERDRAVRAAKQVSSSGDREDLDRARAALVARHSGITPLRLGAHTLPQPTFPGSTQPQQASNPLSPQNAFTTGTNIAKGITGIGSLAGKFFGGSGAGAGAAIPVSAGELTDVGAAAAGGGALADAGELLPLIALAWRGGAIPKLQRGGESDDDGEIIGRGSWYGQAPGWRDYGDRPGSNALRVSESAQGIATRGRGDLGEYFNVWLPGKTSPELARKSDIGPARWTGRDVDVSANLASQNYAPGRYPTDAPVRASRITAMGSPPGLPEYQERLPGGIDDPNRIMPRVDAAGQPVPRYADVERAPRGTDIYQRAAGPTDGGRDYGGGPGGQLRPGEVRNIPGLEKTPPSYFQRVAANPFWQLGGAMLAGRSPYAGVNIGQAMMSMGQLQREQRKQDLLDEKPELITLPNGEMGYRMGSRFINTGLISQEGLKEKRAQEKEMREETKPVKGPSTGGLFAEDTYMHPVRQPDGSYKWERFQYGEGPRAESFAPAEQPAAAAPAAPPATAPAAPAKPAAPAPAPQVRQAEAPAPAAPTTTTPQQPASPWGAGKPGGWEELKRRWAGQPGGGPVPAQPQAPSPSTAAPAPAAQTPPAAGAETIEQRTENLWKTGKITPVGTVTNPAAVGQGRNDAALEGLKPNEQNYIKDIADYRRDPRSIPMKHRERVMGYVENYDRTYNQALYPTRAQALKEFGVNGQGAKSLQSNSMVLEHIGDAMTATEKLGNFTVPLANLLTGKFARETGNTQYQEALRQFQAATQAAAVEAAKTFRGVGSMSHQEEALWSKIIAGQYDSPVELRAALKQVTGLVMGRLNATSNAHNIAMGPAYERDGSSWISDKANETVRRAASTNPQQPIPPSRYELQRTPEGHPYYGPAEEAPATVTSIDEARKLGKGRKFIIPEGPSKGQIGTVP